MNRIKTVLIIVISCIIAFFSFSTLSLEKKTYRPYNSVVLSDSLKLEIKEGTYNLSEFEIIKYCNQKTRKLLSFSNKCEPFDDNRITKMHCVGYARVYSTICNYALKINKKEGIARPVVGIVKWNGINLNDFSKFFPFRLKNFTKDHDFVEIKYEDKIIYMDPTLNIINIQ